MLGSVLLTCQDMVHKYGALVSAMESVRIVRMCAFCAKRPAVDYYKGRLICWFCLNNAKKQHLDATEGRARRRYIHAD